MLCVILQPERGRELWHGCTPTVVVATVPPGRGLSARCVHRRKIPEKTRAQALPLARSGTLRSCLGRARAFLTRRNHLSAPARWVDPNLRFSLIPTSTPPTPAWPPSNLLPFSPTGSRHEIASLSRRNSDLIHSASPLIS